MSLVVTPQSYDYTYCARVSGIIIILLSCLRPATSGHCRSSMGLDAGLRSLGSVRSTICYCFNPVTERAVLVDLEVFGEQSSDKVQSAQC